MLHNLQANTKLLIGLCLQCFLPSSFECFSTASPCGNFHRRTRRVLRRIAELWFQVGSLLHAKTNPFFFWEVLRSGQLSEQLGAILTCRLASASLLAVFWLLWRPWTCFYKCWSQDLPHTCPKPTLLNAVSTWQTLQSMKKTCPSLGSLTSDVIEIALRSRGQQQSFSCSLLRECSECKEVPLL